MEQPIRQSLLKPDLFFYAPRKLAIVLWTSTVVLVWVGGMWWVLLFSFLAHAFMSWAVRREPLFFEILQRQINNKTRYWHA